MMGILVGSWDDGIGRSMTISVELLSDGDWELTSLYQYQHHQGMDEVLFWLFDPQQKVTEDTKLGL